MHRQNFLLAALPAADYKRFTAELKPVRLPLGATVYKADVPLAYAYFPTTSIVSMVSEMPNGETAEIAITGNDGMVGTPLLMGATKSPNDAIVQCAGARLPHYRALPSERSLAGTGPCAT